VNLIGRDPAEVRATDIQYLQFCLDMFFYASVRNGQLGRYALANMCMDAFYAPCTGDENGHADARFTAYDIWHTTSPNVLGLPDCDTIDYEPKSTWPNWE
jgi:hypothetical protein